MRKIVQIAAIGCENNCSTQSSYAVFALCDDGTMWESFGGRPWYQLPPIPQDQESGDSLACQSPN